jgi:hypothetical protein
MIYFSFKCQVYLKDIQKMTQVWNWGDIPLCLEIKFTTRFKDFAWTNIDYVMEYIHCIYYIIQCCLSIVCFKSITSRLGRPFNNVIHLIWSLVSNSRCAIASKTNCAAAISNLFARTHFNQRSKYGFNTKKTIKKYLCPKSYLLK